MSSTTETFVIAAMCLVSGILMILLRRRFARSTMEMLRGFETDMSSEGLQRICDIGMGIFGFLVIVVGLVIGIRAL